MREAVLFGWLCALTPMGAVGRLDYVLPSRDLELTGSGVWHPSDGDPHRSLVTPPDPASDHAVDVRLGARP